MRFPAFSAAPWLYQIKAQSYQLCSVIVFLSSVRRLASVTTSYRRVVRSVCSTGDANPGYTTLTLRAVVDDYKHDYCDNYASYHNGDCNERHALSEFFLFRNG